MVIKRYLKNLVFSLWIIILIPQVAKATQFKGVDDLMSDGQMDTFIVGQIAARCYGLHGAFAMFLPAGDTEDKMVEISNKFLELAIKASTANNSDSYEAVAKNVFSDARYFVAVYESHMKEHQRNTGSILSDFVDPERFWCLKILETYQ